MRCDCTDFGCIKPAILRVEIKRCKKWPHFFVIRIEELEKIPLKYQEITLVGSFV
ncbi:hypothetical protein SA3033_06375 [Aggregatibacter actinomycetemcomitans serotype d str. SA3033]|nr:hypothetical protein HMPREF9996_00910 [Aggregatibacter actinomycetemcomitans Y4]KYK83731.1 hypothetical protein SA3033_06375 [Aggregatibacter actinomycetemcomitans serotype d str. SA3033]KYK87171.1 hypothetical protein SA2200_06070 [Aggregatibacter actinomycetemcomitans serotype d str. SA2200]KYK91133.1 hypothetical protein SA508_01345 [Aggregatibacter actinomycetemcomitans serotype d str. SA508]KYK92762.1 hypothetical protein SA269_05925 [Aggregatibacter actinomycetemcomitans serotype d str